MDWGKIAVVLFAIAAVAYCSSVTSDPEPTTPSTSAAPANALPPCPGLREHVLKTASIVKKITDIRCKADGDGYTLSVIYGESPSSMNQVESLSKATAGLALDYLKANGVDPYREKVFLSVWSQKPEAGVTGQQMWRVYGSAIYNYNTDQMEFTEQR